MITKARAWDLYVLAGPHSDDCFEWPGATNNVGYGTHGSRLAHRESWIFHNGPIPEGMFVCHRCDNRRCIRASHLFLGTAADNTADMIAKGRGVSPRGEQHGLARLTDAQIEEIRARAARGETRRAIAAAVGCDQSYVTRLVNRARRPW